MGLWIAFGTRHAERVRRKNFQEVPEEGFHGNHQEVADEQQFCCNVRLGEGNQLPQPDSRQDDRRQGDRTSCGCPRVALPACAPWLLLAWPRPAWLLPVWLLLAWLLLAWLLPEWLLLAWLLPAWPHPVWLLLVWLLRRSPSKLCRPRQEQSQRALRAARRFTVLPRCCKRQLPRQLPLLLYQTWALSRFRTTVSMRPARLRLAPKILARPATPKRGLPADAGSTMRAQ